MFTLRREIHNKLNIGRNQKRANEVGSNENLKEGNFYTPDRRKKRITFEGPLVPGCP